jgi:hypothetical protein
MAGRISMATEPLAQREEAMMKSIRASRLTEIGRSKRMMWRSLAAANLPNAFKWDFKELQRRAEQQIEQAEIERTRAALRASAGTSDQD